MSDWKPCALEDICEIYDGPHATPTKQNSGPYFLSISSLQGGQLDLSESAFLSEEDYVLWTKRVTPKHMDIVFSYETRLGQAGMIPDGLRCCLGRRMGLLRIKDANITDTSFLLHYYLGEPFQRVIKDNTVFGTTVDRIPLQKMGEFPISLPPLPEQKKIAEILSGIDSTAEKLKGENAKYQALLVSMRQRIFDEEGAVIHRFDEIVSERVLGTTRRGTGARESIPLVKMGDIMRGNIKIGDNERIEYDKDLDDLLLRKGDILFNTRNTPALVGKTAIHDSGPRCTFDNNLMRIRVVSDVDSWYLNHLMNSPQFLQSLSRITAGTTSVAAIYWNDLRRLKVPLPSIGRQRQIVKSIASIHSAINNLAAKICCLEELESATSYDLLSGRKRVSI